MKILLAAGLVALGLGASLSTASAAPLPQLQGGAVEGRTGVTEQANWNKHRRYYRPHHRAPNRNWYRRWR